MTPPPPRRLSSAGEHTPSIPEGTTKGGSMSTFPFGQSKEVVLHVRVEPLLYLDASEITPENLVVSLVQAAIDQLRHHLEEEPERLPEFLTRTTILDTYDQQEEPEPPECPKCGSVKVMWSGGSSWECCDCGKAISYDIT